MARNPRRMALYEVIKSSHSKVHTAPQGRVSDKEAEGKDSGKEPLYHGRSAVRSIGGRIVISISYRIAAICVLSALLCVLVVFRLGQISGVNKALMVEEPGGQIGMGLGSEENITARQEDSGRLVEDSQVRKQAQQSAQDKNLDHVVIIATIAKHRTQRDLEPVRDYFGSRGVETAIVERGGYYFLQTKQRFASPKEKGSKLTKELNRIKEIGRDYTAPNGYESFGANLFQDAYGMKL